MNCNYKVKIKDIQNKYQFKIFCKTYDDTEIQGDIETLNSDVEALQEENLYLNSLVEQAFDKKEVEGEELSIDDTINAKMEVGLEGNTTQKTTTGKNKWGSELQQGARVFSNGTLNTSLTTYVVNKDPIPVIAGQTYTISAKGYNFIYGGGFVFFNDGTFVSGSSTNNTRITIPSGCNQLYYNFYNPDNISVNDISDIQLEPGSTASSYEKYTGGVASPNPSYPSNVNVVTGDNTIVVNGKQLFDETYPNINANLNYKAIYVGEGNFTLKSNTPLNTSNNANLFFLAGNVTSGASTNTNGVYARTKRTQDSVNGYITIAYRNIDNVSPVDYRTILYKTSQEQTFQINLGNIEVCGIGDYRDYLYKSNNKWYLHKEIGKVVLDGSENWYKTSDTSASVFVLANVITTKSYGSSGIALSSHYKYQFANTAGKFYFGTATNIALCMDTTYDLAGFKTWIGTNNVTLYYILNTPTDTEITDTTLISQLEALKTAMSYAEQTNISQINDDIPFILKITALASYNSRIVALENAILNANRSTPVENTRKSNEVIEEPKEEVVDDNKDKNIIKEEK